MIFFGTHYLYSIPDQVEGLLFGGAVESLALAANTLVQLVVLGQVVAGYLSSLEVNRLDVPILTTPTKA